LIHTRGGGGVLQVAATSAILILALRISRVRRSTMMVVGTAAGLACTLTIVATFSDNEAGPVSAILCAMLFVTPFAIGRRIMRHTRVDIETLAGAVNIYVLIGLFFASLYAVIVHFTAVPFFAQAAEVTGNQINYFSFVTLATLGYGDLTPATDLGRSLVVFEAMVGQVFLVTALARIVSMLGADRPRRAPD
jgi:voltage-gated potassium channel Kch